MWATASRAQRMAGAACMLARRAHGRCPPRACCQAHRRQGAWAGCEGRRRSRWRLPPRSDASCNLSSAPVTSQSSLRGALFLKKDLRRFAPDAGSFLVRGVSCGWAYPVLDVSVRISVRLFMFFADDERKFLDISVGRAAGKCRNQRPCSTWALAAKWRGKGKVRTRSGQGQDGSGLGQGAKVRSGSGLGQD